MKWTPQKVIAVIAVLMLVWPMFLLVFTVRWLWNALTFRYVPLRIVWNVLAAALHRSALSSFAAVEVSARDAQEVLKLYPPIIGNKEQDNGEG